MAPAPAGGRRRKRLLPSTPQGIARPAAAGLSLREAQPPGGQALSVIVVVEQFINRITGEREKCVAIENARVGLKEGVGAKAVLVDFEHEFAVAAIGPERARRQARVHDRIEVAKTVMASVRLNTMSDLPESSPSLGLPAATTEPANRRSGLRANPDVRELRHALVRISLLVPPTDGGDPPVHL